MNSIKLHAKDKNIKCDIHLTASKSESNRVLLIRALCNENFKIENLAEAADTQTMQRLLEEKNEILDVGPAGTAMRFLIAYYSIQPGTKVITGSSRMKERPVAVLVNALKELGADITYLEKEGFPPVKINGKKLKGGEIAVDGNISSQYITALLLIAPVLENGLYIKVKGHLTSRPYVNMTIEIMKYFGAEVSWEGDTIKVKSGAYIPRGFTIEGDWSAASYWYEIAALAEEADITLHGLKKESLQGDAVVADIFKSFGVETFYKNTSIQIKKTNLLPSSEGQGVGFADAVERKSINQQINKSISPSSEGLGVGSILPSLEGQGVGKSSNLQIFKSPFNYDFSDCPDIAQTVAVTMAALKINGTLTGLHSLKIKETDRILALKNELEKTGCNVQIGNDWLTLAKSETRNTKPQTRNTKPQTLNFSTYEDHRMAMAFAPLALILPEVIIENPEVVNKSYPGYWDDLREAGFLVI